MNVPYIAESVSCANHGAKAYGESHNERDPPRRPLSTGATFSRGIVVLQIGVRSRLTDLTIRTVPRAPKGLRALM